MSEDARSRGKEGANLDNDHRECVHVRFDGGSSLPTLLGEDIEKLWSGPTDSTPGVGRRGIDRSYILCDRRKTEIRKEGVTLRIDEDIGLWISPASQDLRQ